MLLLDNNLLSDYLDGKPEAKRFLEKYEHHVWAVSSIVLFEAFMGCVHGYIDGTPRTIHQAVSSSMEVLDVSEQTAVEAASLQEDLQDRGVPADHPEVLVAAAAREHGADFATAEKHFWKDEVRSVLSVVEYDPYETTRWR